MDQFPQKKGRKVNEYKIYSTLFYLFIYLFFENEIYSTLDCYKNILS